MLAREPNGFCSKQTPCLDSAAGFRDRFCPAVCHSVCECLRGIRVLLAILFTLLISSPAVSAEIEVDKVPDARQTRPDPINKVIVIDFEGEINYERERYFNSRFKQAEKAGCDVLLIEIDSPGGLKNVSLDIARKIRNCKWAYTVVLIKNEAISGGALMSLGSDEIQISPNAKFGDIGEINFDFEEMVWREIEDKVGSYLYRDARDLAESKGRPPELAESMVDKNAIVYLRKDADGGNEFKLLRVDADPPDAPWQVIPETGANRYLTLSGTRAKQLGVAQRFAESRDDVLATFEGGTKSQITVYRHTTTDTIVHWLNNPVLTGLILVLGLVALYFELSAPGIGVGGLIATLCATLFFWSRMSAGTSGWLEVILFLAGITFILMEIFVIPGFGVAGIGGLLLLLASVVLASQDFVVPSTVPEWNQLMTTLVVIALSGVIFVVAAFFITRSLGSLPLFNRLVLNNDSPAGLAVAGGDGQTSVSLDGRPEISIGDVGKSKSLLRPSGEAVFSGQSYDVVSDGSFVDPGAVVKVIRIQGNMITVMEVEE